jgi:hypothetical protein
LSYANCVANLQKAVDRIAAFLATAHDQAVKPSR